MGCHRGYRQEGSPGKRSSSRNMMGKAVGWRSARARTQQKEVRSSAEKSSAERRSAEKSSEVKRCIYDWVPVCQLKTRCEPQGVPGTRKLQISQSRRRCTARVFSSFAPSSGTAELRKCMIRTGQLLLTVVGAFEFVCCSSGVLGRLTLCRWGDLCLWGDLQNQKADAEVEVPEVYQLT